MDVSILKCKAILEGTHVYYLWSFTNFIIFLSNFADELALTDNLVKEFLICIFISISQMLNYHFKYFLLTSIYVIPKYEKTVWWVWRNNFGSCWYTTKLSSMQYCCSRYPLLVCWPLFVVITIFMLQKVLFLWYVMSLEMPRLLFFVCLNRLLLSTCKHWLIKCPGSSHLDISLLASGICYAWFSIQVAWEHYFLLWFFLYVL